MRGLGQPFDPDESPTAATGGGAFPVLLPTTVTKSHDARVSIREDCKPEKALVTGERPQDLPSSIGTANVLTHHDAVLRATLHAVLIPP